MTKYLFNFHMIIVLGEHEKIVTGFLIPASNYRHIITIIFI